MNNKTLDEIADKIQKLQAMVEGSRNQNEVEVASAKIQSLLAEYNLSMEQVKGFSVDKDSVINDIWDITRGRNLDTWRGGLINSLSKFNFCRAIHISGTTKIHLFGKPKNVEIVKWLYNFISSRLENICSGMFLLAKLQNSNIHGRTWKNSFYIGAVSAIHKKLAEQHGELENTVSGRELVIVRAEEVNDAVNSVYNKGLVKHNAHSRILSDAYHSGIDVGNKMTLGKPVDYKKAPQIE